MKNRRQYPRPKPKIQLGSIWPLQIKSWLTLNVARYGELEARFLSLARNKLRLCSANHRASYFSNMSKRQKTGQGVVNTYFTRLVENMVVRFWKFIVLRTVISRYKFLRTAFVHIASVLQYAEIIDWLGFVMCTRLRNARGCFMRGSGSLINPAAMENMMPFLDKPSPWVKFRPNDGLVAVGARSCVYLLWLNLVTVKLNIWFTASGSESLHGYHAYTITNYFAFKVNI